MLIPRPDIRIISRKIMLANGAEALAYFAVIDVHGVFQVKFLGTKTLSHVVSPDTVFLLENPHVQFFGETQVKSIYEIFSPFYTLDFLMSQLARAPSVK